jgi:hypothetical protein
MKALTLSLALPLFLLAADASADSYRCGTKLASNGDRTIEVENKCGAPSSRNFIGYTQVINGFGGVQIEEWVYGPANGALYFLRFEGGRLTAVESKRQP